MTSRMQDVRSSITTLLEALVPETSAARVYKSIDRRNKPNGSAASMHRRFWFELGGSSVTNEWSSALTGHETQFVLIMAYQDHSADEPERFDRMATDAIQILRAINTKQTWPAGVDAVRCERYDVVPDEQDESDTIVFSMLAQVQEEE